MKIKLLKDCLEVVPKNTRLMGLDLGTKTIGVAVSDSLQNLATPVTTVKRTKFSKDIVLATTTRPDTETYDNQALNKVPSFSTRAK